MSSHLKVELKSIYPKKSPILSAMERSRNLLNGKFKRKPLTVGIKISDQESLKNGMLALTQCDETTQDTHPDSEVATFYGGKSILITGASGFVGKSLLEKLLRSCPNLERVFVLMRAKRGQEVGERVDALIKSELFDRLRNSSNGIKQLNKIRVIEGDITKPLFGLSEKEIELLNANVSIIIHSAATVKFVEPLEVAVKNNVVSAENMINLASKLTKLEALVHISTAYSNCHRKQVNEVLYESPIEANLLIDLCKAMDPVKLEKITPYLLGKRPNTYTFTKAVAESLVVERSKKLLPNIPVAIIRPSIVTGAWKQPIRGWVDNFNGATGVILSMATGVLKAMMAKPTYNADIIPVDIVSNLIICSAWQIHQQHHKMGTRRLLNDGDTNKTATEENESMISIYNCASGTLNPVVWNDFVNSMEEIALTFPCNNSVRLPGTLILSNKYVFGAYNFINHAAIAHMGDLLFRLSGRKPQFVRLYKRLMKMIEILIPFSTNQWSFTSLNAINLYEKLSPIDKEIFNFDVRQLDWTDYLRRYYIGAKLFALKDDPNQIVETRRRLDIIRWFSRLQKALLLFIIYYFFLAGNPIEWVAIETIQLALGISKNMPQPAIEQNYNITYDGF